MRLYLVRHGKAEPGSNDDERSLMDRGRSDLRLMGAFLKRIGVECETIWHSPKMRSVESAGILAEETGWKVQLQKMTGFGPDDDARQAAEKIDAFQQEHRKKNLLVVTHMPFISDLASLLVGGPENLFQFPTSGCLCLEREGYGSWQVRWLMRPNGLRG